MKEVENPVRVFILFSISGFISAVTAKIKPAGNMLYEIYFTILLRRSKIHSEVHKFIIFLLRSTYVKTSFV